MSKKKVSWDLLDTAFDDVGGAKSKGTYKYVPPCYESHKPLPLGNGLVVYGGSCSNPVIKDADVYVALDWGFRPSKATYPWNPQTRTEVYFPIPDMNIPTDSVEFVNMISWLVDQIKAEKKVHVGCIGGHGRTGMVLAALVRVMMDNKDSIAYVRKNYCSKAVETDKQITFLHDVFGITKVKASKTSWTGTGGKSGGLVLIAGTPYKGTVPAVAAKFCLWGPKAVTSADD